MGNDLKVCIPVHMSGSNEKMRKDLIDLVFNVAIRILDESPSNLERAVASKILGRKCEDFRLLTVEDFLADVICNGDRWKEFAEKLHHLGYVVELAPLVLYILVKDRRFDDVRKLFPLVDESERIIQRRGGSFTDVYVEIMKWIAKKVGLEYSPPKDCLKVGDDFQLVIKTVLYYEEMRDQNVLQAKYIAQKRIAEMLKGDGIYDVLMLYFASELSNLLSIPNLPRKDQLSYLKARYRKNRLIYYTIKYIPEIASFFISFVYVLKNYNLINLALLSSPLCIFLLKILIGKFFPKIGNYILEHWSYLHYLKMRIEKDDALIKKLQKIVSL